MRKIWALDFGAEATTVVVAEEKSRRDIKLLAKAQYPTRGLQASLVTSVGDIVESVFESVRSAERMCGLKCDKLNYNYDDASIEIARPAGSKTLAGEGQIGRADIADAERIALRTIGHFERSPIFVNPIHFLMDGKDSVVNPIGVFGHELEVRLFILLGRAAHVQQMKRVFERAGINKTHFVVTALSAAYGVLDEAAHKKRTLVWDMGRDLVQGAVTQQGILYDFDIFVSGDLSIADIAKRISAQTREIMRRTGFIEEVVLTGDLSEKDALASALSDHVSLPMAAQSPTLVTHLTRPQDASLAGLVHLALEKQSRMPSVKPSREALAGLKDKTTSFLNDYF
jgi:cell division protein FtsA